jgi:hypothetical protein
MNTKKISVLKNLPAGPTPTTQFCIAINVTKYQAPAYLYPALILNGQYASHAMMFDANKSAEELITGMYANYAEPSALGSE